VQKPLKISISNYILGIADLRYYPICSSFCLSLSRSLSLFCLCFSSVHPLTKRTHNVRSGELMRRAITLAPYSQTASRKICVFLRYLYRCFGAVALHDKDLNQKRKTMKYSLRKVEFGKYVCAYNVRFCYLLNVFYYWLVCYKISVRAQEVPDFLFKKSLLSETSKFRNREYNGDNADTVN